MNESVYVDKYTKQIIACFGTPDEVINRMLDDVISRDLDIEEICQGIVAPPESERTRMNVEVNNEYFNELRKAYPVRSSRVSLSRLLCWFMSNEMYNEFGWKPIKAFCDKDKELKNRRVTRAVNALRILRSSCSVKEQIIIDEIVEKVQALKV